MKPVIFLDFDGVISTFRAFVAQAHIQNTFERWIDPVAVMMLETLLEEFPFTIVISSTWRRQDRERFDTYLGPKLSKVLEKEWRTGFHPEGRRGPEIEEWLLAHGNGRPFIILDDEVGGLLDHHLPRVVQCDTYDGFSMRNFEALEKLLKS